MRRSTGFQPALNVDVPPIHGLETHATIMIFKFFHSRRIPSSLTPVRRKPKIDFSLTGLVFCSMMMFMGVAAMNTQANLLFSVFGLMIAVLLVSYVISLLVL